MSIRSKRKFLKLIGGALLLAASGAAQPLTWSGPKKRIAVMSLAGTGVKMRELASPETNSSVSTISLPPPAEFALGLTDMLTSALVATQHFVVLERANIEQVLAEQNLGETKRTSGETAAAAGRLTGAQFHITGDITEFSYQQTTAGGNIKLLKGLKSRTERVTAMVALDLRLVDAVTGEVTWSKRFSGKAAMLGFGAEYAKLDREIGGGGAVNTPLGQASREAIEKAAAALVEGLGKTPWEGRVVAVRAGMVYINAGKDLGLKTGVALDVFEQQEALIDPATGRTLGTPDKLLGSLVVETVEDQYSIARAVSGQGFARNQLVRAKGQRATP